MKEPFLYLASQSGARQRLLESSDIAFQLLVHTSSESVLRDGMPCDDYVRLIAQDKMEHVNYERITEKRAYVLTADTLVYIHHNDVILGKPKDRDDAKRMLRLIRDHGACVVSGCCLYKIEKQSNQWILLEKEVFSANAEIEFCVDEHLLDQYLDREPTSLLACGAGVIEGYGQNFLRSIKGSYSAVLGLPLFELRQNLIKMGFFN